MKLLPLETVGINYRLTKPSLLFYNTAISGETTVPYLLKVLYILITTAFSTLHAVALNGQKIHDSMLLCAT